MKKQKRKQQEEAKIAQGKERSHFDSISSSSSSEGFTSEEDEQVDPNRKELIKSHRRKKRAVHMELFQRKYNRMSYVEKANEFEI